MVYEYAVEPDLVATWGTLTKYRFFMDNFGLGTPRRHVRYPRDSRIGALGCLQAATGREGMELQRITAMVNYLAETMVKRNDAVYNEALPWLENAEEEHAETAFSRAILGYEQA